MTQTITCCMDLVDHPDFKTFCQLWQQDKRIPLCMPDWLREWGLWEQATTADWALTAASRPVFGNRDVLGGPTPHKWSGSGWAWIVGNWIHRVLADELLTKSKEVGHLFDSRQNDTFEQSIAFFSRSLPTGRCCVTQTLTAAELLASNDHTFLGLLAEWGTHYEPPVPLIDYLLEQGLERQAACVRWVLEQPERRPDGTGYQVKATRPFPLHYRHQNNWSLVAKKVPYGWSTYDKCDGIEWLTANERHHVFDFPTLNDALCFLLDSYPEGDQ